MSVYEPDRWTDLHVRSRSMLNRLTALAAQLELLAEQTTDKRLRASMDALRADAAAAARDASALIATLPRARSAASADLSALLRDTLAPLHRWLLRRGTELVVEPMPCSVTVAMEPEIVRSSVASAIHTIANAARTGEEVHVTHRSAPDAETLILTLHTSGAPPSSDALRAELAATHALLSVRNAAIRVRTLETTTLIELELPAARSV